VQGMSHRVQGKDYKHVFAANTKTLTNVSTVQPKYPRIDVKPCEKKEYFGRPKQKCSRCEKDWRPIPLSTVGICPSCREEIIECKYADANSNRLIN